jgi:RimJ/RimL family protein N-acetyltransferase
MAVRLLEVTDEDLPAIDGWLRADHVRRFWGDPESNARLLRARPQGAWRAIIEADGRKVGLVLWQPPSRHELDEASLRDIPETVVDVDIMIGEAGALGRGIAPAAIRLVAERALADPEVPFVIAAAMIENAASLRAFEKAGFRKDREFDDVSSGRCALLVRHRQGSEGG